MLIFGQNLPNYYETKADKLGFEDFFTDRNNASGITP